MSDNMGKAAACENITSVTCHLRYQHTGNGGDRDRYCSLIYLFYYRSFTAWQCSNKRKSTNLCL